MEYFVITNTDGSTLIEAFTKAELESKLNHNYWGNDIKFLDSVAEANTNYWRGHTLIIKGSIVKPESRQVTTQWVAE